ncbi:MAG: DUF167 domain-containing protein [Verrucomicrobiota bacterium]|nr:DUF167 domain-containing protein [Verrucomicrobiota bacterium]
MASASCAVGVFPLKQIVLIVKVIPKASREEIVGWEGDVLKVRLRAAPEKGKANAALISFLAKALDLPKRAITLVSGETSRHKRIVIEGLSLSELQKKVQRLVLSDETPPEQESQE